MLALTDAALAHLVIGATAIEPRSRRRWLQDVADRLDPSPAAVRRAQNRIRYQRWAVNDKAGVAVTRVRYNGEAMSRLIRAGWLTAHDAAYTDAEIGRAISDLIMQDGELPRKATR